jgi:hypothetical protein
MKRFLSVALVAALILTALVALAEGSKVNKLSTYGYKGETGNYVYLVVDHDIARYRGGEKFLPLLIFLGHNERKTLYADRGCFTLTDPTGAKHAMPSAEEVTTTYPAAMVTADYTMLRTLQDYASSVYMGYVYIPKVAYFPNPAGSPGVLYDHVEVPNRTYFSALVYFPNPAGKATGSYTLTYDDPKSGTHIEVPFPIEWQK